MPDSIKVPLLDDLAQDGFFYGGHYIVEFDSDSLWYETSLTIAALALKQGVKTEYHVFQHPPGEAIEAFSKLGLDAKKLQEEGLLVIWDSYTDTLRYETEKKEKHGEDENLWVSTHDKPLNAVKSAARWAKRAKEGYPEQAKRWLHIDDNTAIFLQYNDEEVLIDAWRTGIIPYSMRAREAPHFLAFVKGVASEAFYTKYEATCDGIIDVKAQEQSGKIENYIRVRMLRGKTFDSTWHRLALGANGEVELVGAAPQSEQRRLAAIMFTDIVGYTALTQSNERLAMKQLEKHRELIRPILMKHSGREVKTIGDAFLVEFGSALDATECAMEMQQALHNYNGGAPDEVLVRVGIHLGDVIHKDGDVYGDAVNIASRIEPLAKGGEICISQQVYDQVRNKVPFKLLKLDPHELKNVAVQIDVYRVEMPWEEVNAVPKTGLDKNRIAVLPFVNMSPDPNDEYFAEGMTEEIISTVSGISGLSVISRTSVMRYKQTSKSITEIGRELKVGKLLEGSVRKSGNRVRITVQLIDAEGDAHLWAQSYDRNMEDIFETQTDIARKIADALKLPSPRPGGHQESPDAYTLYLRARSLWNRSTREANEQAMLLFDQAMKIDSESARAFAGIADCYATTADYGWMDRTQGYAKARQFAKRALELDDALPEAHAALGYVMMEDDYNGAEIELKKAISLNPNNADAHQRLGEILRGMSRLDEALEEAKKAYELDPLPPARAWLLVVSYYFVGRYDESLAVCTKLIQTEPGFSTGYFGRAVLTSEKGAREEAYRDLQTYRRLTNEIDYKSLQARIEANLGNEEESSRLIDETLSLIGENHSPEAQGARVQLSYACSLIGDKERFFPLAEYLVDRKVVGPGELNDPKYQNMREDLRFAELFKKLRKSYGLN